jgi:hypothetical protein
VGIPYSQDRYLGVSSNLILEVLVKNFEVSKIRDLETIPT